MTSPWTTTDCLAALRSEAEDADFAAIVVGYDRETRFVWSGRDDPGTQRFLAAVGENLAAILEQRVAAVRN